MTLRTWKKEYYPIPADSDEAKAHPVQHSQRKWEGLRPENMARHHVEIKGYGDIADSRGARLNIDADSCALCQVYVCHDGSCEDCPLYQSLGKRCDTGPESPYFMWKNNEKAEPMIRALSKIEDKESLEEDSLVSVQLTKDMANFLLLDAKSELSFWKNLDATPYHSAELTKTWSAIVDELEQALEA